MANSTVLLAQRARMNVLLYCTAPLEHMSLCALPASFCNQMLVDHLV